MPDEPQGPVVLINAFTVAPAEQDHLVALLKRATQDSVVQAPGFLSATLHRSFDGAKVTIYARWASAANYARMRQGEQSRATLEAIASIATFDSTMFEIVDTFLPPA